MRGGYFLLRFYTDLAQIYTQHTFICHLLRRNSNVRFPLNGLPFMDEYKLSSLYGLWTDNIFPEVSPAHALQSRQGAFIITSTTTF
jgi:hypothetical protein